MADNDSLRETFSLVQGESPDEYAKDLDLAGKVDLDVDTVKRNRDVVGQQHWLNTYDFDGLTKNTPRLATWLEHPNNAAVAQDDLEDQRKMAWLLERPDIFRPKDDESIAADVDAYLESKLSGDLVYNSLDDSGKKSVREEQRKRLLKQFKAEEEFIAGNDKVGFLETVKRSGSENPLGFVPFLGSAADAGNIMQAWKLADAVNNGTATPDQEMELERFHRLQSVAAMRGKSAGGYAGGIVYRLPSFVGEVASGAALGKAGAQAAGKVGAVNAFERSMGKALLKLVGKRKALRSSALALSKPLTGIAGVTASLPVAGLGIAATEALDRMSPDTGLVKTEDGYDVQVTGEGQSWQAAVPRAVASAWIELASESAGGAMAFMNLPSKELFKLWGRKAPGASSAYVRKLMKDAKFEGALPEFLEERVGDVMRDVASRVFGEDQQFQKFALPSKEQALGELAGFMVPGAVMTAADQAILGDQVKREQELLRALEQGNASKLGQRSPESQRKLVEALTKNGPIENVYLDREEFSALMQNKGVEPEVVAEQLGFGKAFREGEATGTIKIPTGAYASAVMPSEYGKEFKEILTFQQDGLTPKAYKAAVSAAKAQVEREDKVKKEEEEWVRKDIEQGLTGTMPNTTPEQVKAIAQAWVDGLQAAAARESVLQGKRVGIQQFWRENPILFEQSNDPSKQMGQAEQMKQLAERGILQIKLPGETSIQFLARTFKSMTPAQRVRKFATDFKTGLLGTRTRQGDIAWEAKAGMKPFSLDVEGVKYFNDSVSHTAGDALYRAVAQALAKVAPGSVKVGGDFMFFAADEADAERIVEEARQAMPERIKLGEETVNLRGLDFVITEGADARLKADAVKKKRVEDKKRAERGQRPLNTPVAEGEGEVPGMIEGVDIPVEVEDAFKAMPADQQMMAIYFDEKHGMLNGDGFYALPEKAFKAHADLDHLGLTNQAGGLFGSDEGAREAGDEILEAASEVMVQTASKPEYADIDIAHISGDEYYAQSDNADTLEAYWKEVEASLLNKILHVSFDNGKIYAKRGVTLSVGIGGSHDTAERQSIDNKKLDWRVAERKQDNGGWVETETRFGDSYVPGNRGGSGVAREAEVPGQRGHQEGAGLLGVPKEYLQGGVDQTQTPEFKAWFGDSKVVDEQGRPLVVYHGTNQDIKEFLKKRQGANTGSASSRGGFFFTESAPEAADYADMSARKQVSNAVEAEANAERLLKAIDRANDRGNFDLAEKLTLELEESEREGMTGEERGANILPVYISIENPMMFDMQGKDLHDMMAAIKKAKKAGHDGLRLVNVYDPVGPNSAVETNQWVAFKPTQIKSAIGNRGTFDPADPSILNQSSPAVEPFYSRLIQTLEAKLPAKASAEQVRGLTKDLSAEEKKWLGLDEFLTKNPKVEKSTLVEFLRANMPQVQEVVKNDSEETTPHFAEWNEDEDAYVVYGPDAVEGETFDNQADAESRAETLNRKYGGDTKFGDYQLPGGENYREVLFTLPSEMALPEGWDVQKNARGSWTLMDADGRYVGEWKTREAAIASQAKQTGASVFKSSHWDEPNVLAHVRLNDRTDADGKRVLFVEEIQSDWHQKGRKEGYAGEAKAGWKKIKTDSGWAVENADGTRLWEGASEAMADQKVADFERRNVKATASVPDAPFRKTWHEFAFKRILRMAAEGGYDSVAWTTGEQQAERYDLSKQLSKVKAWPNPKLGRGNDGVFEGWRVTADNKDGREVINEFADTDADLEAMVGKDLAKKIIESNGGEFSGLDLKVGGEGMKGFYDKILVDYAGKFGKKFGAKVGETEVMPAAAGRVAANMTKAELAAYKKSIKTRGALVSVHSLPITPELKAAALGEGFSLFQSESNKATPMARILQSRQGGKAVMTFFQSANVSSGLHEFGHYLLNTMAGQAAHPNAPQALLDDTATIAKHLGLTDLTNIPDEAHEKFVNTFLKYLENGQAPSEGLRKVFAKFRVWLLSVWREIRIWADIEVTPEMRGVFDRMLASEEAIDSNLRESGLIDDIPMPGPRSEEYRQAVEAAKERAQSILTAKAVAEFNREKLDWWKSEEDRIREEVKKEVAKDRIYEVVSILTTGKKLDGSDVSAVGKIDAASVPKGMHRELPKGVLTTEGGVSIEVMAEMLRYDNAGHLLRSLREAKMRPFEKAVDIVTEAKMAELYPDLLSAERLEPEALEAIHNDTKTKALELALEILWEQRPAVVKQAIKDVARRPPSAATTKAKARAIVSAMTMESLNPQAFLRQESRAAKEAGILLAKGDILGAYDAKTRELLAHESYKAAVEARTNLEYLEKVIAKKLFQSDEKLSKSRDLNIVQVGREVLQAFGLGKQNESGSWLNAIKAYDPAAYSTLASMVQSFAGEAVPYKQATVEQINQLHADMKILWKLTRDTNQINLRGQVEDKDAIVAELVPLIPARNDPRYTHYETKWDKFLDGILDIRAALRRMEHWTEAMGPVFKRILFRPVSEAVTQYKLAAKTVAEKHLALVQKHGQVEQAEITSQDLGWTFKNKAEIIGALMHTGNASNLQKLLVGRDWGKLDEDGNLDTTRWDAFLDDMHRKGILVKADWEYVQGVWDLLEELKPLAQKAHRSLYGFYFSEVTAQAVQTPFGEFKGGYFPAVVDKNHPLANKDVLKKAEEEVFQSTQQSFLFPTTGKGFTKKRVDAYAGPLNLDPRMVSLHIDKVLRFAYIQPTVSEVYRLVQDRTLGGALKAHDKAVMNQLIVPFLQRAASQRVSEPGAFDTLWKGARTLSSMNAMVGNVVNTIQQFTGFSISAVKVKPGLLAGALAEYVSHPAKTAEMVRGKSDFMKTRSATQAAEVQQQIAVLLEKPQGLESVRDFTQKNGYAIQEYTQGIVDMTTWLGAYNQAVREGQDEKDAVAHADSMVRLTQGSFNPEDSSRVETLNSFSRMFTMFYSYFNMQANLLGTEFHIALRDMGLKGATQRSLYVYVAGLLIPVAMSEMLYGLSNPDDDDESVVASLLGGQAQSIAAMVPGGNAVMGVAIGAWTDQRWDDDMRVSPVFESVQSVLRAPAEAVEDIQKGDLRKKTVKDVLTAMSYALRLPLGWLGRPLGYLADDKNEDALGTARGLITGR